MVDFGLPVKVGGLWVKPGDLIHADHHGVVVIPPECAAKLAEAVAAIETDERKIIGLCQSKDFTVDKLKDLYKQIRPGTY
jgi:regulator of RNase E activity RraA